MHLSLLKKIFVIVLLFSTTLGSSLYAAGTPSIISYQGRLANASGNLLGGSSGTTYYFKFSIWNVSTGGTTGVNRVWPSSDPNSFSASVREGVFNANIGDTANGYPDTLDYDFNSSSDLYIQVEVSSDNASFQTLSPRQRLTSVPYARLSGAVSGTSTPSSFGTTSPFGTSIVSIEATSTHSTGLTIRGILGQLANLFQIQNSLGTNLFVIDSIGNVGVGTSTATRKLNVLDVNSVPQLRLSQSSSVYGELYVDSTGDVQISSTGGNIRNQNENFWVCSGGSCGATAPLDKGNLIVETSIIFNNNFRLKQIDASTTIMYDTTGSAILEFDEGE